MMQSGCGEPGIVPHIFHAAGVVSAPHAPIAEGCSSRKVGLRTCIAADEGIASEIEVRTFGPGWMAGRLRRLQGRGYPPGGEVLLDVSLPRR
jgi:hypothetical protein